MSDSLNKDLARKEQEEGSVPSSEVTRSVNLFVTYLGTGWSSKAPGTVGSLAALPLVFLLDYLGWQTYFAVTLVFIALSLWMCSVYLRQTGRKDPKEIVVDEVAGVLLSFFLVPLSLTSLVVGFVLFRLLDILKPPPISVFDQKVPGAAGVMLDDLFAGFLVNMFFHFVLMPGGWI